MTVSRDARERSTVRARASRMKTAVWTGGRHVVMKRIAVLVGFLVAGLVAAVAPPGRQTEAQANCFQETNFCITTPQFADYFAGRGGSKTLGFPISRTFKLEGFQVQFFQRVVLQLQGSNVSRLNLLDPNMLPITKANQSVFPKPDPQIAAQAPQQSSPSARDVLNFFQRVPPTSFRGRASNTSTRSTR